MITSKTIEIRHTPAGEAQVRRPLHPQIPWTNFNSKWMSLGYAVGGKMFDLHKKDVCVLHW